MQVRKGLQQVHFSATKTSTLMIAAALATLSRSRPGPKQDWKLASGDEDFGDICNCILFPALVFAGRHLPMAEAKSQGPTVASLLWLKRVCKASVRGTPSLMRRD